MNADYIIKNDIYKKVGEIETELTQCYLAIISDKQSKDYVMGALNIAVRIKHLIADEPTTNVREDVHAKSEKIFDNPYTGRMFTTCSNCCGKIAPKDKFCKHCGARMEV